MAKYFKSVKSYSDLKSQFKVLLKANHPGNGGDPEIMKEIDAEYATLFDIWREKEEKETGEKLSETAGSTCYSFCTDFGLTDSNCNSKLALKRIAKIVRAYIKERYPLYKFIVRTSYSSAICQELCVDILQSPVEIYKSFEELTNDDFRQIARCLYPLDYEIDNYHHFLNASKEEKKKIIDESENCNKNIMNNVTSAVIADVDAFVNSCNYHDCDRTIDYFDVVFCYLGCCRDNGASIKIVPKTPRIKK